MHVAQEIDVGEVEVAGAGTRRTSILAEEVTEKNVQLVTLPHQHHPHEGALPLLPDEVDDGTNLPREGVVSFLQRRLLDVDLCCSLNTENVMDPRRIDSLQWVKLINEVKKQEKF